VFLGVVQVVVYTGAVMMLFLFVLMLVGVDASDSLVETLRGQRIAAIVVALAFGILLIAGIGRAVVEPVEGVDLANSAQGGNVQGIAALIFTRYLWAFEVTSALLITAALGAMILAHRERVVRRLTQRELAIQQFHGEQRTPLPVPGVYARHNSVDTPALLPDGTPAESSIPVPLGQRGVRQQTPTQLKTGHDELEGGDA
jgi:NADH-quinone oxidoreductase subunit J